jgi:hypothetical protein
MRKKFLFFFVFLSVFTVSCATPNLSSNYIYYPSKDPVKFSKKKIEKKRTNEYDEILGKLIPNPEKIFAF